MSFTSLLIHTCDIGHFSSGAQDAYGTPVKTWSDSYSDQACRLMSTGGREVKVGAEVVVSDWKLYVENDVVVTEQDRVDNICLASTGATLHSDTFEIILVLPKADSIGQHHKELYLRKVA